MNLFLVDTQFARAGFVFVGMRNPSRTGHTLGLGSERRDGRWCGWNLFLTNPTVSSSSRYTQLKSFVLLAAATLVGHWWAPLVQGSLVKDHPQKMRWSAADDGRGTFEGLTMWKRDKVHTTPSIIFKLNRDQARAGDEIAQTVMGEKRAFKFESSFSSAFWSLHQPPHTDETGW